MSRFVRGGGGRVGVPGGPPSALPARGVWGEIRASRDAADLRRELGMVCRSGRADVRASACPKGPPAVHGVDWGHGDSPPGRGAARVPLPPGRLVRSSLFGKMGIKIWISICRRKEPQCMPGSGGAGEEVVRGLLELINVRPPASSSRGRSARPSGSGQSSAAPALPGYICFIDPFY